MVASEPQCTARAPWRRGSLPDTTHTAHFSPTDAPARILADLACPACGYQDPEAIRHEIEDRKLRVFCDCCGAFVTILLTDEQTLTIQGMSGVQSGRTSG